MTYRKLYNLRLSVKCDFLWHRVGVSKIAFIKHTLSFFPSSESSLFPPPLGPSYGPFSALHVSAKRLCDNVFEIWRELTSSVGRTRVALARDTTISRALSLQPPQPIRVSVRARFPRIHQSSVGGGPPWRRWREGAETRRGHSQFSRPGSRRANGRGLRSEGSEAWGWRLQQLEAVQVGPIRVRRWEEASQSVCKIGETQG